MDPLADTLIEDPRWESVELAGLAERAATETLAALGLSASGLTLCVMGCDDARIAVLNAGFRGRPQPTNVLSWPSEERKAHPGERPAPPEPGSREAPESLGDIALAWDTCATEAAAEGLSVADHATHLIVHGILHLLGYDHAEDADAALMERTETRILASLGLADPYDRPQ